MQTTHPTYSFRLDRRTIYLTAVHFAVYILAGVLLYRLYEGGYLSAWFTSFVAALIALMTLSIPRRIAVTDQAVEIRCLCDITEIRLDEIASVRTVPQEQMRLHMPLFAGCGFFGYYGHFLDIRGFDTVLIYASEWRNFVEITDIYDDRVIVSCRHADELIAAIDRARIAASSAGQ